MGGGSSKETTKPEFINQEGIKAAAAAQGPSSRPEISPVKES